MPICVVLNLKEFFCVYVCVFSLWHLFLYSTCMCVFVCVCVVVICTDIYIL